MREIHVGSPSRKHGQLHAESWKELERRADKMVAPCVKRRREAEAKAADQRRQKKLEERARAEADAAAAEEAETAVKEAIAKSAAPAKPKRRLRKTASVKSEG